jgi:hypothetical protein
MPLDPEPNYPASLDSLPDPTSATYEDDDGFELDLLLQKHNAILEALEGKVGVGSTTPARSTALYGGAGGVGIWDVVARRNRLLNGDFRINQRVTAVGSTDNSYGLDRWRLLLGAANAANVQHEGTDVPTNGSNRALKLTVGSANNNKFGCWQVLEFLDVADLRGKTVSLQFKAKATSGITDVRAAVVEFTGTADSVSGDPISAWNTAGTNPTLAASYAYDNTPANLGPTTSWATYRVENIPIGASANNLAVFIWCDDTSTTTTTDALRITDVQLEEGAVCTDVERVQFGEELARCQRYYTKSYALATAPATATTTGAVAFGGSDNATSKSVFAPVRHKVSMRTLPTITLYDAAGNSGKITTINAAGATTDNVSPTVGAAFVNADAFTLAHTGTIAGVLFHYTADAEL